MACVLVELGLSEGYKILLGRGMVSKSESTWLAVWRYI